MSLEVHWSASALVSTMKKNYAGKDCRSRMSRTFLAESLITPDPKAQQ
jgi:hypothetical protein